MADNLSVRDGGGDTQTLAAKDVAGVKVTRHNIVDESNAAVALATSTKQDALAALIGEVQESPTSNTLLDRLKALLTGIVLAAGSNLIGKVDHASTDIGHGHKEVAPSGTPIVLAASTPAKYVTLQAYRANTGFVAVGTAGVSASAAIGTGTGISLAAGESVTLAIDNLADVYIDASVSGEGVRYIYGT